MPSLPRGPEGVRALLAATRVAFPDLRYAITTLIGEGEMVAVLYAWTGTHRGAMGGLPPTGRTVSATGAIVCRVAGGKIVEQWDIDDRLDVIQQRGLMPAPASVAS
jgi:predicted ester cyclase